jgi:Zn finger protein HypA/HybF involved in hydrogenase expression
VKPEPERYEFRCRTCRYGICVEQLPVCCPLCRSETWVFVGMPEVSAAMLSAVRGEQPADFLNA